MNNRIIISKPYLKKENSDMFGKSIKLCSMIKMINPNTNLYEKKECFFEFDAKYEKYICVDRSDAFVMGLLISGMESGYDIEFESPISERLYYQMTNYYIPLVSKNNNNDSFKLFNIKLLGNTTNEIIDNKNRVATGCSGGVDSFYTIVKHKKESMNDTFKLTHIVYSSSGVELYDKEKIEKEFKNNLKFVERISNDYNLELIACYNNLYDFYKKPLVNFVNFYTTTFASVAFALQKLIKIYYVSSGHTIDKFSITSSGLSDGSVFDLFTVDCLNTENLSFYLTGMEVTRNEKIKVISEDTNVQRNLFVCGAKINGYIDDNNYINCSKCKKCVRTMFSLYSIGKLEKFKEVFNVDYFKKNIGKLLGKALVDDLSEFNNDSIYLCKKNNIKLPISMYIYKIFIYGPIKLMKKIFKSSKLASKLYYKLNLDIKLNGYRSNKSELYLGEKNENKK